MTCGSTRFRISQIAALALSISVFAGNAVAQQNGPGNRPVMDASKARVVDFWTNDRRQQAQPRDFVIDPRGLGYLRRPDGSFEPYGHQITAEPAAAAPSPQARPPAGGGDTTGPSIANMNPGSGSTIGASASFSATVTDSESGVRSVAFIVTYPDGTTTQSFTPSRGTGDVWSVELQGFTDGNWSWSVEARDNAKKGGNRSNSGLVSFSVDTGGSGSGSGGGSGGSGSDTVTNGVWNFGGDIETAAGRIYFQMPSNSRRKRWTGYVCSGTVVTDGTSGRSIVLTAAHCVYDDANKAFARNVLFIPDQADTTGSGTDTNCSNDPLGCWVPTIGIVDFNWTDYTFPDNIEWDYAYYVVADTNAHEGNSSVSEQLDMAVPGMTVSFSQPNYDDTTPGATSGDFTHALGYSYSEDPKFMYCAEDMTTEGAANWWLPSCGLSGGSSGGSWIQPMSGGAGPVISVNSWGYTTQPGMAGPRLDLSSASCLFVIAKTEVLDSDGYEDGDAGVPVNCD